MPRLVTQLLYVCTALMLWVALGYLVFWDDVGRRELLETRTILAFVLLLAAPAATFVPLSRWVAAPLYDVEGIAGWSFLGFMLAFAAPDDPLSLGQFVAFLISLTIAVASAASMIAYLVGLRVVRDSQRRRDFLRARRQGYLASFFIVSIIVLGSIETLTVTSAAMMLVIVVLAEMLALARTGKGLLRAGIGPRRPRSARST